MTKTTIYLDEKALKELKAMAFKLGGINVAGLIRKAISDLLHKGRQQKKTFANLSKLLKQKPRKTSFGDAMTYQKSLRDEWDDE